MVPAKNYLNCYITKFQRFSQKADTEFESLRDENIYVSNLSVYFFLNL